MESQSKWKSEKKEAFFSVNLNDFSVNEDHSMVVQSNGSGNAQVQLFKLFPTDHSVQVFQKCNNPFY